MFKYKLVLLVVTLTASLVQPNTLFMDDITNLFKYESFVCWNDEESQI